jgi:predicted HTH transcriptional regulator
MPSLILLALLILAILVIVYLIRRQTNPSRTWQTQKKQGNEEKVLAFLHDNESATNNDIEKLLQVSDATATRYLSELKQEGKIEQLGITGRSVKYVLKK